MDCTVRRASWYFSNRPAVPKPPEPLLSDFENIAGRRNPKIWLASALNELTRSPSFSWRAATSICALLRIEVNKPFKLTDSKRDLFDSAVRLLFSALESSPDDAYRIASGMGRLAGCREDHLSYFFGRMLPLAEESPLFVLKTIESFGKDLTDPGRLKTYADTILLTYEKGGEAPALRIAGLFSRLARFPESARLMLESFTFHIKELPISDFNSFAAAFSLDWENALDSEAFRDNPD